MATIPVTGDAEADELLAENPLALLIGMLLDQQVPMEWAFRGPLTLKERLGGTLDAETIAALGEDKIEAIFRDKPAMHRYPGSMGKAHTRCAYMSSSTTTAMRPRSGAGRRPVRRYTAGCVSCPATATRRRRSFSPSWASGSAWPPRGGRRRRRRSPTPRRVRWPTSIRANRSIGCASSNAPGRRKRRERPTDPGRSTAWDDPNPVAGTAYWSM
jgi:hypothetical protein